MGKYLIIITEVAKKDFEKHKKAGNASLLKKVDKTGKEVQMVFVEAIFFLKLRGLKLVCFLKNFPKAY